MTLTVNQAHAGFKREASDPHGFLSRTLGTVSTIRALFLKADKNSERWDIVLLGQSTSTFQLVGSLTNMDKVASWDLYFRRCNSLYLLALVPFLTSMVVKTSS
jgi:hypothetical protein